MPPEVAQLAVLLVEIRGDRAALADQRQRIAQAVAVPQWRAEDAVLSMVAVALHHYYGAAERIFERIARCCEGVPGRSDRWHQELLDRMALDIPGLRPAVRQPETRQRLGELLSFRHFFRHAYAVARDPVRLRGLSAVAVALDPLFAADLDLFQATLGEVIADGR